MMPDLVTSFFPPTPPASLIVTVLTGNIGQEWF